MTPKERQSYKAGWDGYVSKVRPGSLNPDKIARKAFDDRKACEHCNLGKDGLTCHVTHCEIYLRVQRYWPA